jgi:hypothetical protein
VQAAAATTPTATTASLNILLFMNTAPEDWNDRCEAIESGVPPARSRSTGQTAYCDR